MFRFAYQKAVPERLALGISHQLVQTTSSRLISTSSIKPPVSGFTQNKLAIHQVKSFTRTFDKRNVTSSAIETPIKSSPEPTEFPTFWSRAKELTKREKEWTVSEEEAQKPEIVRPILFFFAVGISTFAWAAWMTIKENEATAKIAIGKDEYADLLPNIIQKEKSKKIQKKFKQLLNYKSLVESGSEDIYWGELTEAELRNLRKAAFLAEKIPYDGPTKRIMDSLNRRTIPSEIVRNLFQLPHLLYLNYDLILPGTLKDEKAITLPICASMASIALAIKFGKSGLFGKGMPRFLGRNIMRTPAAIRLHTLSTSAFSHTRLVDVFQYSSVILFFGSSYLELPKQAKDGNRLHTAEATTFYHFLAFCITAGTFASVSSQVFSRLLLRNVSQKYGREIGKKLIGRVLLSGAGGIAGALIGNYLYHSPCWERDSRDGRLSLHDGLATGCGILVLFEVGGLALGFIDRRYLGGIDRAARLGGVIFGFMYARYGNAFWESMKRFFYDGEEQLFVTMTQTGNKDPLSAPQPSANVENDSANQVELSPH